ncbi:MAG: hypothetical protein HY898_05020 [Deltaproteobacteria bacterium]|nr:hypothetical protein [Deltaproteobacteria bacterium]
MEPTLSGHEMLALIQRVFQPKSDEHSVAILVDLPDRVAADHPSWAARRAMALDWARQLHAMSAQSGLRVSLCLYRNVRHNNADLPDHGWLHAGDAISSLELPATADDVPSDATVTAMRDVLRKHPLILAPTQFSATAPLKLAGRELGFRAATMPGFSPDMIPALRLDYVEINRRVQLLKDLLDRATGADFEFLVDSATSHKLHLDLRFRTAHASGGLLPQPGTAGNLPSGEAYIVPYEGEKPGEPSRSEGQLPVELDGDLVVYRIEQNRAIGVIDASSDTARREAVLLGKEPAYGNLAELGLGVLADFGVQPCGEILLDEKLGLHIAFGRSDHFGGRIGASDFSCADAVVHIDRVYTPNLQPRVRVRSVVLHLEDGREQALMRDDRYAVSFER